MELTRYERIVWKLNALIILVAGSMALFVLAVAGFRLLQDLLRTRHVSSVVNITPETRAAERLMLGQFSRIEGTDWLSAPLNGAQEFNQSYYEKSGSSVRNYLFFNANSKKSHWLINGNSSLVTADYSLFSAPSAAYGNRTTVAHLYVVVNRDSNGDSRLSSADQLTVLFAPVGATTPLESLSLSGDILGVTQISPEEALVTYRSGGDYFVTSLSVATGKVISKTQLPPS